MQPPLTAEGAIRPNYQGRQKLVFTLLVFYFGLYGIMVGAQGVLWAEIVLALGLSKGAFGNTQLIAPLIAVALLLMGGQLSAWGGKKRLALIGLALLSAAILTLSRANSVLWYIIALVLSGAGGGLLETAMNGATLDWERATGRSAMNLMHAGFSAGAVGGAFAAGSLLGTGWGYDQILLLLAVLWAVAILATLPVGYPPADHDEAADRGPGATLRLIFSSRTLIGLAALSALGIVGEGVAILWQVIYLRELGAAAFTGGVAFALFNGAMFLGRILNVPLMNRFGARISLFTSGVGLVVATVLLMIATDLGLAIAAFFLVGLAVAGVIPTALSVAAKVEPGNSGAIAGGMMAAAYAGFIVIPPISGWLAEQISLRHSLIVIAASGVGVLWLARGVRD